VPLFLLCRQGIIVLITAEWQASARKAIQNQLATLEVVRKLSSIEEGIKAMKEEIAARQAVKELARRAEKGAAEKSFQQDPPTGLFASPKLPISTPEITEANVVQAIADVPQDKIEVNRSKKWEVPRLDQDKIQSQQSEANQRNIRALLSSVPDIVVMMKLVLTRSAPPAGSEHDSSSPLGQSPATHREISH